jgi:hypothetical protein
MINEGTEKTAEENGSGQFQSTTPAFVRMD